MAKVGFNSENKSSSPFDFPKLSLGQGEKARIVCIEPEPEMQYVHTLRQPAIKDGEAVYEDKTFKGKTTRVMVYDFMARYICLGSPTVIDKEGYDKKQCPLCAASEEHDTFDRPARRFAMHVVKYKTTPGGFKVQEPFGAELLVWSFTDRVFNSLVDITEEHGDLRKKDLMLGPCENKQFQKFDINIGGGAEWLKDDGRKDYVKTLYAENAMKDMTPIIARPLKRDGIETEINMVRSRIAQVSGSGTDSIPDDLDIGSGVDLDNLLGDEPQPEEPAVDEPGESSDDLDEMLPKGGVKAPEEVAEPDTGSSVVADEPDPEPEAEEEAAKPPAKKTAAKKTAAKKAAAPKPEPTPEPEAEDLDFDAMFADL